jgi:HepT-like protein
LKNRKEVLRFKAEIMEELENVSRIVSIIEKRKKEIKKHGVDAEVYLDSIIHNIENFYMGIEEIFKRIAMFTDEGIPEGSRWHSILIKGMARDIPGVRPPVIKDETRLLLDEYRKFRHLVRNIYTFNIIPQKITKLAQSITKVFNMLQKDLTIFLNILEKITK